MHKRIIVIIFCIFQSIALFASASPDSTGIENNNGKMVILHKVDLKESYFSIGRKYAVSPRIIMDYNGSIALQPGTILKVPTERLFQQKNVNQQDIIEYKVGPKETLIAIAERFNTTVEELRLLNNIKGSLLSVGQVIKVKQGTAAKIQEPVKEPAHQTVTIKPVAPKGNANVAELDTMPDARLKNTASRYGLRELTERGVAVSIDDENIDGTKMLALHRTAPVGTVIKITNPMSGKSTFAKVVGKFTENESTKDVIIVVSKATANLIGALDKRFQVNIVYGVPNEL